MMYRSVITSHSSQKMIDWIRRITGIIFQILSNEKVGVYIIDFYIEHAWSLAFNIYLYLILPVCSNCPLFYLIPSPNKLKCH
jgi:hypothetical protein